MIHAPETLARHLTNVTTNLDMAVKEHHSGAPETPGRMLSAVKALQDIAKELEEWVNANYPLRPNGKRS